ncbi:hypothetical protein HDV05_004008 [Chytridiales sp. JEL 0842]|nr:hypothetical protein HDV05_004008 [Chytridiales sp. JEL 0842]
MSPAKNETSNHVTAILDHHENTDQPMTSVLTFPVLRKVVISLSSDLALAILCIGIAVSLLVIALAIGNAAAYMIDPLLFLLLLYRFAEENIMCQYSIVIEGPSALSRSQASIIITAIFLPIFAISLGSLGRSPDLLGDMRYSRGVLLGCEVFFLAVRLIITEINPRERLTFSKLRTLSILFFMYFLYRWGHEFGDSVAPRRAIDVDFHFADVYKDDDAARAKEFTFKFLTFLYKSKGTEVVFYLAFRSSSLAAYLVTLMLLILTDYVEFFGMNWYYKKGLGSNVVGVEESEEIVGVRDLEAAPDAVEFRPKMDKVEEEEEEEGQEIKLDQMVENVENGVNVCDNPKKEPGKPRVDSFTIQDQPRPTAQLASSPAMYKPHSRRSSSLSVTTQTKANMVAAKVQRDLQSTFGLSPQAAVRSELSKLASFAKCAGFLNAMVRLYTFGAEGFVLDFQSKWPSLGRILFGGVDSLFAYSVIIERTLIAFFAFLISGAVIMFLEAKFYGYDYIRMKTKLNLYTPTWIIIAVASVLHQQIIYLFVSAVATFARL